MADEKLPDGWLKRESKRHPGRFFYFNLATGKPQWHLPSIGNKKTCYQVAKNDGQPVTVQKRAKEGTVKTSGFAVEQKEVQKSDKGKASASKVDQKGEVKSKIVYSNAPVLYTKRESEKMKSAEASDRKSIVKIMRSTVLIGPAPGRVTKAKQRRSESDNALSAFEMKRRVELAVKNSQVKLLDSRKSRAKYLPHFSTSSNDNLFKPDPVHPVNISKLVAEQSDQNTCQSNKRNADKKDCTEVQKQTLPSNAAKFEKRLLSGDAEEFDLSLTDPETPTQEKVAVSFENRSDTSTSTKRVQRPWEKHIGDKKAKRLKPFDNDDDSVLVDNEDEHKSEGLRSIRGYGRDTESPGGNVKIGESKSDSGKNDVDTKEGSSSVSLNKKAPDVLVVSDDSGTEIRCSTPELEDMDIDTPPFDDPEDPAPSPLNVWGAPASGSVWRPSSVSADLDEIEDMEVDSEFVLKEISSIRSSQGGTNSQGPTDIPLPPDNHILSDTARGRYLVIDTCVLLSDLAVVKAVLRNHERTGDRVVIPWTVLQELDFIKDGKSSCSSNTVEQGRRCTRWLSEHFSSRHPAVLGQSAVAYAEAVKQSPFKIECNDDRILLCCLQWQARVEGKKSVVFVTNDKNLISKAVVNEVPAFLAKDLPRSSSDPTPLDAGGPPRSRNHDPPPPRTSGSLPPRIGLTNTEKKGLQSKLSALVFQYAANPEKGVVSSMEVSVPFSNRASSPSNKMFVSRDMLKNSIRTSRGVSLPSSNVISSSRDVASAMADCEDAEMVSRDTQAAAEQPSTTFTDSQLRHLAASTLPADVKALLDEFNTLATRNFSKILAREMRAVYDSNWIDVVYKKPPWTARTALEAIDAHQIAVFGYSLPRGCHADVEKLLTFFSQRDAPSRVELAKTVDVYVRYIQVASNRLSYGKLLEVEQARALLKAVKTNKGAR